MGTNLQESWYITIMWYIIENELNKWIEYLDKIESLANSGIEPTEWQQEDIKYTKNMIEKLKKEIKEAKKQKCLSKIKVNLTICFFIFLTSVKSTHII